MAGLFDDLMPTAAPATAPATPPAPAPPVATTAAAPIGGAFDDLMPPAPSTTTRLPGLSSSPTAGLPGSLSEFISGKPSTTDAPTVGLPSFSSSPTAGLPGSLTEFLGGKPSPATPSTTHTPWSGSVLPVSGDANGAVSFDSNAGLLGTIKRAVTLPGDVATGQADPMSKEAIARSADLAGLAAPVNPGVRAGEMAVPGTATALQPATVTPTTQALKAAADTAYKAAKDSGAIYSAPHVAQMAGDVQSHLVNGSSNFSGGMLDNVAPQTHEILNKLQDIPDPSVNPNVPFNYLDSARKNLGRIIDSNRISNPTDAAAAKIAQGAIDDFVAEPPVGAVVAGDAAAAAQAIKDARGNYAAAMRSDALTGTPEEGARKYGIEGAAELSGASADSGANTGNAIRQRVKSLLLNPKAIAGFSDDEVAALQQVARGSPTNNAARIVGNWLGGGGGGHAAASSLVGYEMLGNAGKMLGPTGEVIGSVVGAAAPAIGWAAKHVDNQATHNSLTAADELVRQNSPLGRQMSAEAPQVFANPERQAALVRALGLSRSPQPQRAAGGRVADLAVPEGLATLAAQRRELIEGKRAVLVFKGGHRRIPPPHGMREFVMSGDVVQYNPAEIGEADIRRAQREDRLGALLRLGPVSKNEAVARIGHGETPVAVVERDHRGVELRAAAGTHATADRQLRHMQKTKSAPSSRIGLERPETTLLERLR